MSKLFLMNGRLRLLILKKLLISDLFMATTMLGMLDGTF